MAHQFHESRAILRSTEEVTQHGLCMVFGRLPDRTGDVDFVDAHRGHVYRDRRVDAVVRKDCVQRSAVVFETPLWGQVDRVPEGRFGRRPGAHERLRGRRQLREPHAVCDELIDTHDGGASRIGDDGHAISTR